MFGSGADVNAEENDDDENGCEGKILSIYHYFLFLNFAVFINVLSTCFTFQIAHSKAEICCSQVVQYNVKWFLLFDNDYLNLKCII